MTTPRYDPNTQQLVPAESYGVSEAQRAQVIQRLADAFAADRISMDDLDARLSRLYQVQTLAQLEQLLDDPSAPGVSLERPLSVARPAQNFALPERGVGIAIMGGYDRGEGWVLPRHFRAVAVMGGVKLDLRDARIAEGVSEIEVFTVWGGVEIIVPDGVRVEVVGMAVMGGFDAKSGLTALDDPNAPVLRVSGFALMGGVEIKRKDRGRKNERRYVEALERAERLRGPRGR
jgi:Domain of unknown function (DUF1707)/Cell wall-active antibiotics response 4TMS YvqF